LDCSSGRPIRVHLLPGLFEPQELRGGVAVVIDVLRATTTLAHALEAKAARVVPCGDIDEARQTAAKLPAGSALLGGERGGLKIAGFDLGNSPAEYIAETVAGKTVVFTTTNGTRALLRAREADRIVTVAFANLNAVVAWLARQARAVHLVCAGTDGHITLEDVLCAGAIAWGLRQSSPACDTSDDGAGLALGLWENRGSDYDRLVETLRAGRGGRNLVELGHDADIVTAARFDTTAIVPELSRHPWQIVPAIDATGSPRRFVDPPRRLRV